MRDPYNLKVKILIVLMLINTVPLPAIGGDVDSKGVSPLSIFKEVWKIVSDNFYDPGFNGLNWSATRNKYAPLVKAVESVENAAPIINKMLSELNTSHTAFYTRYDREYYQLLDIFKNSPLGKEIRKRRMFPKNRISCPGIGIFTETFDGNTFIKGVLEGSPAYEAGLKAGYRIISVNGSSYHPVKSFLNHSGNQVAIKVQYSRIPADIETIQVIPQDIEPGIQFYQAVKQSMTIMERKKVKIAYVHLWSYAGEIYQQLLQDEIAFGKFKDADALILDLRDGWGGANPNYLNLFNKNVPVMTRIARDGKESPVDFQWRKPVVMLVNQGTRSGKEILAHGFKRFGTGKVVGTTTAGAVVGGRPFLLSDGSLLYLAVESARIDGEVLEGKGVVPDVEVPFPLAYRGKNDPQIEKAMELLSDPK